MMESNFAFLQNFELQQQAQRIEKDLQTGQCQLAAPSLRYLLERYVSQYQLKKRVRGRCKLLRHLASEGYHINKKVFQFMEEAAHGNLENPPQAEEILKALEEIHKYMRFHHNNHIPSFESIIYNVQQSTEPAKPKTSAQKETKSTEENKELDIRPISLPEISDIKVQAFQGFGRNAQMQALASYFDRKGLREKVETELTELLEQLEQDCKQNFPYDEEQQNLQYYSRLNPTEFMHDLQLEKQQKGNTANNAWQQLPSQAQQAYAAEIANWRKQTQQKKAKEKSNKPLNFSKLLQQTPRYKQQALQNYILQKWFGQFALKRDKWLQQQIDTARKNYLEQLQKQMEQFEKFKEILAPFGYGLGRLWDMSKGELKNINWDVLKYYEQLLQNEKSLQELAELLGRYRKAESSYEKKLIEISREVIVQKSVYGVGEKRIGLEYGNKLSRIVPKEWLTFADEDSELLFLLKYSQKRLLQYKTSLPYFDRTKITSHKEEQYAKESEQGPFILCVDTSGSMHGLPEQTAKILCYVLARFAIQSKRKLFLINFSTGIECLDLSSITYILADLIQFLCMSFHGGTDITPAMRKALEMMKQENYKKADLLLISDGLFPNLNTEDKKLVEQQKQQDTKFYSLMIGSSALPTALDIFDQNWSYNLGESYEKLVEKIRTTMHKETVPVQ